MTQKLTSVVHGTTHTVHC